MNEHDSFSNSIYEEQTHLAERELSAFISAVTQMFGPEQARVSTEDWLEESELMDGPPRSTNRNWRSVTIAGFGSIGKSSRCRSASAEIHRCIDRYQGIANTIVQLFRSHSSGLMLSSKPMRFGSCSIRKTERGRIE